jgi:ribonuclease BN (tRNA processing enzyme)
VTVVGSSCSIPRPGRACSSYLLESATHAVVADLGTGAFANLRRYLEPDRIDAVVISHMHADHFLDVVPLRYALKYGNRVRDGKLPLYLPPGGEAMLRRLVGAFAIESGDDFLGEVFDVRTFDPAATLETGDVRLRFAPTSHYVPTFALRADVGDASVTYSADTAPDDRVVALARDSSAFICEATLAPEGERELPRGHLSAREAAKMAADARVERLLLSHYPASADVGELEAIARSVFDGDVTVVDDGYRVSLGDARPTLF